MDERKELILRAIIKDYVKSAEPVASRTIAKNYNLGISAATVRNEMYDLEELGFLEQPHTSSGRIPSAKGYRFYVDSILHKKYITREDSDLLADIWKSQPQDITEFIQHTAKVISQISHNISMVLSPPRDMSIIICIHVLPTTALRALMVIVTDSGALDNEHIFFDEPYNVEDLQNTAFKFSNFLKNKALAHIDEYELGKYKALDGAEKKIFDILSISLLRALSKRKLFYSVGTPELLGQPEFRNFSRIQPILNLIEEEEELSRLLTNKPDSPITIKIGRENSEEVVQDCSIIQADFSCRNEHIGTLAILGPTRMEYGRLIGMLNYMHDFIEEVGKNKDNTLLLNSKGVKDE